MIQKNRNYSPGEVANLNRPITEISNQSSSVGGLGSPTMVLEDKSNMYPHESNQLQWNNKISMRQSPQPAISSGPSISPKRLSSRQRLANSTSSIKFPHPPRTATSTSTLSRRSMPSGNKLMKSHNFDSTRSTPLPAASLVIKSPTCDVLNGTEIGLSKEPRELSNIGNIEINMDDFTTSYQSVEGSRVTLHRKGTYSAEEMNREMAELYKDTEFSEAHNQEAGPSTSNGNAITSDLPSVCCFTYLFSLFY